jgi:hypothetical protein
VQYEKNKKLRSLLLLTDESLLNNLKPEYHQCGTEIQLAQWQEFIKCFPDEA